MALFQLFLPVKLASSYRSCQLERSKLLAAKVIFGIRGNAPTTCRGQNARMCVLSIEAAIAPFRSERNFLYHKKTFTAYEFRPIKKLLFLFQKCYRLYNIVLLLSLSAIIITTENDQGIFEENNEAQLR